MRCSRHRVLIKMPAIKPEIKASVLAVGLVAPLVVKGSYYTAFFVAWWLVIWVGDVRKAGEFYPYGRRGRFPQLFRNSWFMIVMLYLMWAIGVLP